MAVSSIALSLRRLWGVGPGPQHAALRGVSREGSMYQFTVTKIDVENYIGEGGCHLVARGRTLSQVVKAHVPHCIRI